MKLIETRNESSKKGNSIYVYKSNVAISVRIQLTKRGPWDNLAVQPVGYGPWDSGKSYVYDNIGVLRITAIIYSIHKIIMNIIQRILTVFFYLGLGLCTYFQMRYIQNQDFKLFESSNPALYDYKYDEFYENFVQQFVTYSILVLTIALTRISLFQKSQMFATLLIHMGVSLVTLFSIQYFSIIGVVLICSGILIIGCIQNHDEKK